MRRRVKAVIIGTIVTLGLGTVHLPARAADPVTLRILVLGDSITAPCTSTPAGGWCARLGQMLAQRGVNAQWTAVAVPGVRCKWLASQVQAAVDLHDPDIVLINCGTNDDPKEKCWGESCTAWAQRVLIETAHNSGAQVATAFVGYPDLLRFNSQAPQEVANDAIYSNLGYYTGWNLGLANFQVVPGNPDFLPDGIHPTSVRGIEAYARIWYDVGAGRGWWPANTDPPLCGLFGRRAGYQVPSYIQCEVN
jgi:hypothetical protein